MTLRSSTDWTQPETYAAEAERRSRLWSALRHVATAIGVYVRHRHEARARWHISARGSPELPNHLRKDIGLPPVLSRPDVDLYR